MRILFLSNYYPPYSQGGYEQLCREIGYELSRRGNEVMVLTSGHEQSDERDGPVLIRRALPLEVEGGLAHTLANLTFGGRGSAVRRGVAVVEQTVAEFAPDVALVWGMWNVPRVVPAAVERLLPTAYYLCDYWPALPNAFIQRLREPARHSLAHWPKSLVTELVLPKLLTGPQPWLTFRHVACVSEAIRDIVIAHDIDIASAQIIRNGIQLSDFSSNRAESALPEYPLRLIYAGRITPDKGLATVIHAIHQIERRECGLVHLSVYGAGEDAYIELLKDQVDVERLPVTFNGFVPRDKFPEVLAREKVLVLPSGVIEALPRVVIEAMAAGLVVVGTTTGGTGEVLRDGETGLTFDAGDAAGLARQIERLAADPELRARLATAGQEVVMRDFNIDHTVDQLEALLIRSARYQEVG